MVAADGVDSRKNRELRPQDLEVQVVEAFDLLMVYSLDILEMKDTDKPDDSRAEEVDNFLGLRGLGRMVVDLEEVQCMFGNQDVAGIGHCSMLVVEHCSVVYMEFVVVVAADLLVVVDQMVAMNMVTVKLVVELQMLVVVEEVDLRQFHSAQKLLVELELRSRLLCLAVESVLDSVNYKLD